MSSALRINFGKRLRYLRRKKDITQEELAEAVERSRNLIACLESGKAAPSFATLSDLAKALDIEVIEFFNFENLPLDRLRSK